MLITTVEGESNTNCLYYINWYIVVVCHVCCYIKVVLQVGWSFRQLGALTKDRTYQGSLSALASNGKGGDVLAVHRDLCRGLTESWWLSSALHCGGSSDNTPLWP